jgi:hypothetical protein
MDFHPAALLATIAMTGQMPNADGSTTPVSADERLKAAAALAPFVMPRLQATQVTGKDDGALEVATLDLTRILADPVLARQAQDLALAMADAGQTTTPVICAPEPMALLLPMRDPLETLERLPNGHWATK